MVLERQSRAYFGVSLSNREQQAIAQAVYMITDAMLKGPMENLVSGPQITFWPTHALWRKRL